MNPSVSSRTRRTMMRALDSDNHALKLYYVCLAEPGPAPRQRDSNPQAADERAASAAPPSRPRPAEPGPAPSQRDASAPPSQASGASAAPAGAPRPAEPRPLPEHPGRSKGGAPGSHADGPQPSSSSWLAPPEFTPATEEPRDRTDRPGQPPELTPAADPAFSPPGTCKRPGENPRWYDMMVGEGRATREHQEEPDTGVDGLYYWPAP